jgi:ATP-dependent protease ClpP protease subunit
MFQIYSSRTGKNPDYYREKLTEHNWYLSAEEALAEGLVDEVLPPPPRRKKAAA